MYWIEITLKDGSVIKKNSQLLNETYDYFNCYSKWNARNGYSSSSMKMGFDDVTTGYWNSEDNTLRSNQ
jgi:hypothetical protein